MKGRQKFGVKSGLRTIIAGSRDISDYDKVACIIKESGFNISEVVSGTALGVDTLGEIWAEENNIPVKQFPADWDNKGKAAGFIRNTEMADYADALIAVWDGKSSGTKHMINTAGSRRLKIYVDTV